MAQTTREAQVFFDDLCGDSGAWKLVENRTFAISTATGLLPTTDGEMTRTSAIMSPPEQVP